MSDGKHRFMEPAVAWVFDNHLTGNGAPDPGKFTCTALCEELRGRAHGEPIMAEDAANFLAELAVRFKRASFFILCRHIELGGQLSDAGFEKLLEYMETQPTEDLAISR